MRRTGKIDRKGYYKEEARRIKWVWTLSFLLSNNKKEDEK
jgi:hypothetical protein